jgi:hypothetical protein
MKEKYKRLGFKIHNIIFVYYILLNIILHCKMCRIMYNYHDHYTVGLPHDTDRKNIKVNNKLIENSLH